MIEDAKKPKRFRTKKPKETGRNSVKTHAPIVAELFRRSIEQGLTLSDIGPRVGVNLNTLSQWKQGLTFPNAMHLNNLAEALGYRLALTKDKP